MDSRAKSCPILITQKKLNNFVKNHRILDKLLKKRYLKLRSFDDLFPINDPDLGYLDRDRWALTVGNVIMASITFKSGSSGVNPNWILKKLKELYDSFFSTECLYTGFLICIDMDKYNSGLGRRYTNIIHEQPIGLILFRNLVESDSSINCDGEPVNRDNILYGELIGINPDFSTFGIGKIIAATAILINTYIDKRAVVLNIARGLRNAPARHLYESFGFKAVPIPLPKSIKDWANLDIIRQYYKQQLVIWTMVWCMEDPQKTIDNARLILKNEFDKNTYKNSDLTFDFPPPSISKLKTKVGCFYWMAKLRIFLNKNDYFDTNYIRAKQRLEEIEENYEQLKIEALEPAKSPSYLGKIKKLIK